MVHNDSYIVRRASGVVTEDLVLGGAIPLDSDFEGRKVNFASRFLKTVLRRHGLSLPRISRYSRQAARSTQQSNDDDLAADEELCDVEHDSSFLYQSPDAIVFHTLTWLLAKYELHSEEQLLSLLEVVIDLKEADSRGFEIEFDYEYMLRQCRLFSKARSAALCFVLLDAPTEAVDEAIRSKNLDLAKTIASQQAQDSVKKALWMRVGMAVVESEIDMRRPIALVKESAGVLTIDVTTTLVYIFDLDECSH